MSAVAAAIGGAAVIGGASTIIAGQNAANAQSQAADRANQFASTQTQEMQQRAEPWRETGVFANNLLTQGIDSGDLTRKFTMNDFHQDPGYQFQLGQGQLAMQRSAAAAGMLNSEGTQQRLNDYSQGMANTSYQQALQNFTNNQQQRYNMLSGLSGSGLNAATGQNLAATNYMKTGNENMLGQGSAMAAGAVAQGNGIANAVNNGANQFMNYNAMSKYGQTGGGGGMPDTNWQQYGGGGIAGYGGSGANSSNVFAGGAGTDAGSNSLLSKLT